MKVISHTHPLISTQSDVNERYPFGIPGWVWRDPEKESFISTETYIGLEHDIDKLAALRKMSDPKPADALEDDLAKRLASEFCMRDLLANGLVTRNEVTNVELAVQVDPVFDDSARHTIQEGASLFVEKALDPDTIRKAYERSTGTPPPMPSKYEMSNGKPSLDEAGRPKLSDGYSFYLANRAKPRSVEAFTIQLADALSSRDGDPVVLLISYYRGNAWWGGSYYGFFYNASMRVSREQPPRGYFYIRLNADKLSAFEPHWNDPGFWASKIAHEMLHNLGYWHPNYKDPQERDLNNRDQEWAFIVSYEEALYETINTRRPDSAAAKSASY